MDTFSYLVPQCKTKETLHETKEKKKKKINGLGSAFNITQLALGFTAVGTLFPSSLVSFIFNRIICSYQ